MMVVVWWLCVSDGVCVWVMVVVCVSRERYLRLPSCICQSTNDFRHPRLTLIQSAHRRTEGSSTDFSVL